ncbi:hypothetical protein EP7_004908 [Isosphaeraceae bacterium EP7]
MGSTETSQKRIDANRRNAMRSTGPRTVEGKARSRRNSMVHGLAGAGIVVPEQDAQAVRERAEQWNSSLRPYNAFEINLVETIAVESLRIERCRIEDRLARDFRARKAAHCWSEERKVAIEREASALSAKPAATANLLATSAPGCDWLIDRWRLLGHALDKSGVWTDEQHTLALDLLGIAGALRDLPNPTDADEGESLLEHRQCLVDDQLERLLTLKDDGHDDIEEEHREAAMQGLNTVDDPKLILLRRYETASLRRMRWALDLLNKGKGLPNDQNRNPKWDDDGPARSPRRPGPGANADEGAERSQPPPENLFHKAMEAARALPPRPSTRPEIASIANPKPENTPRAADRRSRQARRRRAASLQLMSC